MHIVLDTLASQCDNARVFFADGLATRKLRIRIGMDNLSLLVCLMKNVNQLEEWEWFKTNVIGANGVLVDDWRAASDVISDETYVDSSYDLALMKMAMYER